MKKEDNCLLYKSRSYSACVKAGYNLFTDNFRKLFSSTWILVLIVSLLKSAIEASGFSLIATIRHIEPVHMIVIYTILVLLEIVSSFILFGIIFYLFQQHKQTGTYSRCSLKGAYKGIVHFSIRSSKLFVWTILLYTPIVIATCFFAIRMIPLQFSDPAMHKYLILSILSFILFLIFYLPFVFLMVKYMIEDKSHSWSVITKGYKDGISHWGFSFAVIFLSWLITTIAVLIINMPELVIHQANIISQNGVLEGDPSGLPNYFGILVFIVSSIITFMAQYAGIAFLFPIYYMYGSIETQKIEKVDFENNIEQ